MPWQSSDQSFQFQDAEGRQDLAGGEAGADDQLVHAGAGTPQAPRYRFSTRFKVDNDLLRGQEATPQAFAIAPSRAGDTEIRRRSPCWHPSKSKTSGKMVC